MLLVTIGVARQRLGTEFPDKVLARVDGDRNVVRLVRKRSDAVGAGFTTSELDGFCVDLALRTRFVDKIRYILRRLFIPHEQDWNSTIPDALFFLHYVRKPLKVVGRCIMSVPVKAVRRTSA